MPKRFNPKTIEKWIPPTLDDVCGNYDLRDYLKLCKEDWKPFEEVNLLVVGEPGTGKTSTLISHLRTRWNDSKLGYEEKNVMFAAHRGQRFNFVRIDGASVTEARLNELVSATVAEEVGADHSVVLLDEAGELFHRGLEQKCRPLLEHPSVVTYATAQDFHSKRRKTDTEEEDKNRYLSFLSRFRKKIYTEKPTEEEVFEFIRARLREFEIPDEGDEIVKLLAAKCNGVVRWVMEGLIAAATDPSGKLTRRVVAGFMPNPMLF